MDIINSTHQKKVKIKLTLEQATKAQKEKWRYIALLWKIWSIQSITQLFFHAIIYLHFYLDYMFQPIF